MKRRCILSGLNKPQSASASLCLDQLHSRDVDTACSQCETSPWPNDPETISSEWIALQTSFVILYHLIFFEGPFDQGNKL